MSRTVDITEPQHRAVAGYWYVAPAGRLGTQRFRQICCDCGLAHEFILRVRDGRVQFRLQHAPEATTRNRRRDRFPFARRAHHG